MPQKESSLHNPIKRWIYTSYPQAKVNKINDRSTAGVPDILACCEGRYIGIELKWNHKLTPLQWANLIKIKRAGGLALVLKKDSVGDIDSFSLETQTFTGPSFTWRTTPLRSINNGNTKRRV